MMSLRVSRVALNCVLLAEVDDLDDVDELAELLDDLVQLALRLDGDDDVDTRDIRLFRIAGRDALDIEGAPADEARHMRQDARFVVDQHGKQVFLHL